jgi:hypothetical protein
MVESGNRFEIAFVVLEGVSEICYLSTESAVCFPHGEANKSQIELNGR